MECLRGDTFGPGGQPTVGTRASIPVVDPSGEVNNYHAYPAHAAFGGYKQSGIGRENHKMMLDHYQQTKNILQSYSPNALGFF